MNIKNLLDLVKVIQAGMEAYYGLHVVVAEPEYDLQRSPLEKELGMNLFYVTLNVFSPTQVMVLRKTVEWKFTTVDGVDLSRGHRQYHGRHGGFGLAENDEYEVDQKPKRLTLETEIKSVKVWMQQREEDDDLLCHLRPHVKKTYPKVEVLLHGGR